MTRAEWQTERARVWARFAAAADAELADVALAEFDERFPGPCAMCELIREMVGGAPVVLIREIAEQRKAEHTCGSRR